MTTTEETPRLPFTRPNAITIAPEYEALRRQAPVSRVLTPAGDPAWLVTSYAEATELFRDRRFGRSHPEPERASRISYAAVQEGPSGDFEGEEREHKRMRRMLVPAFSAPRMRALGNRIAELTDHCLNDMQAARDAHPGEPVDLIAFLAFPLPVLVICEMLGVPYADREHFRGLSERIGKMDSGGDAQQAMAEFNAYMTGLADAKRADPQPDVISDLVAFQADDPTLADHDLARTAITLLFAGHETTATRIATGTLFLLTDTARRDRFAADPDGEVQQTVEEILRMTATSSTGLLRYAHEDVTIGGIQIARGDAVLIASDAANRDASVFADPDKFDARRTSTSAPAPMSASAPTLPASNCGSCSPRCSAASPPWGSRSGSTRSRSAPTGSAAASAASPWSGEDEPCRSRSIRRATSRPGSASCSRRRLRPGRGRRHRRFLSAEPPKSEQDAVRQAQDFHNSEGQARYA